MTAMSIQTPPGLPLPLRREWTVADLESLPDDGLRYELLDGLLLVTPAPVLAHQRVLGNLYLALRAACPSKMEAFMAPVDWQPDRSTSLQPDLLVVRKQDLGIKNLTALLVLAVEVLSPSTRRKDLLLKRSKYEDAGIPSYWVVDPDKPSFTAFDLVDACYKTVAESTGDRVAEVDLPFPLKVTPSTLIIS
jgi:Uma2 family endonuclease